MDRAEHGTCPLPADPVLAEIAEAANQAGAWTYIVDPEWRWVYMTDDARRSQSRGSELAPVPLGEHFFSAASLDADVIKFTYTPAVMRDILEAMGPWVLGDTPGGRDELRRLVDTRIADAVDEIVMPGPHAANAAEFTGSFSRGATVRGVSVQQRVYDSEGRFRGVAMTAKPKAGMAAIASMVATEDLEHIARKQSVARAGRQRAAILFADLERSSQLSRRLSTAAYFTLARRLVNAADAAVVDSGGIVGRHVGDGVVAFFLAGTAGSESAAAEACIGATRALRAAGSEVAARSDLEPDEVTMRFGLHWGSTLYMGLIATPGRSEVTALGDAVNETARIEACATGGRALASKELIEQLEPEAAARLDIDQGRASYTPLASLSTATEKARRDAPAIAVCDV
jgi:class 3 adenylate cyclase